MDEFNDKIAISFGKVKEDITFLKTEIDKIKSYLLLKNKEIIDLKTEINNQNRLISNLKLEIDKLTKSSIGNHRVNNDQQQSTTMINNGKQWQTMTILPQNPPIRTILENKFRSLTDREFSVFMAIYQLEEELGKVNYNDVANKLNLSEATIRNFIISLINKGIPIEKERVFNRKALFRIKKDFREMNIASSMLELRQSSKISVDKT